MNRIAAASRAIDTTCTRAPRIAPCRLGPFRAMDLTSQRASAPGSFRILPRSTPFRFRIIPSSDFGPFMPCSASTLSHAVSRSSLASAFETTRARDQVASVGAGGRTGDSHRMTAVRAHLIHVVGILCKTDVLGAAAEFRVDPGAASGTARRLIGVRGRPHRNGLTDVGPGAAIVVTRIARSRPARDATVIAALIGTGSRSRVIS